MEERTLEKVQQEYVNACARLGELHYRYNCVPKEMEDLRERIDALQKEGLTLQKKPE